MNFSGKCCNSLIFQCKIWNSSGAHLWGIKYARTSTPLRSINISPSRHLCVTVRLRGNIRSVTSIFSELLMSIITAVCGSLIQPDYINLLLQSYNITTTTIETHDEEGASRWCRQFSHIGTYIHPRWVRKTCKGSCGGSFCNKAVAE